MSTKLKNLKVNPVFAEFFAFDSKEEERKHNAQMISYRILSEVDRACEERNINKKQLASMVGASASYITQLFRGTKQVNMDVMGRFEEALEICFVIHAKPEKESDSEFVFGLVDKLGLTSCRYKQRYWNSLELKESASTCNEKDTADNVRYLFAIETNHSYKETAS